MGSKDDPYEGYRTLLRNWEGLCILCGEPFDNMESITKEHIIPRSKNGRGCNNLALSHFKCNQVRGDLSLMEAIVLIEARKRQMGKVAFKGWCNNSVPNRRPNKAARKIQEEQAA